MKKSRLSFLAGGALAAFLPLVPLCAQSDAPKKGPDVEARIAKMKQNLSLTDDQVSSIKAIFADQKTKMDAIRADTTLTKEQKREKIKPLAEETKSKVEGVLTPEQKVKAEQLKKERAEKKKDAQN